MEEFKKLVDIADQLLGPNGCPWDREQTYFTLQPYLLEETHELIEAIDQKNPSKISEELGDVLYALIFIAKLGEKDSTFTLPDSINLVAQKLIRRHPHVFGNKEISSSEDVVKNWEAIKKSEGKKSPISDIPPTLPALSRAQKIIHKMRKHPAINEKLSDDIGQKIFDLVREAQSQGVDAESALRRTCLAYEEKLGGGLGETPPTSSAISVQSSAIKKTPEIDSWHKADSLRMLPSGPDLVRTAYSTRSPAAKKYNRLFR